MTVYPSQSSSYRKMSNTPSSPRDSRTPSSARSDDPYPHRSRTSPRPRPITKDEFNRINHILAARYIQQERAKLRRSQGGDVDPTKSGGIMKPRCVPRPQIFSCPDSFPCSMQIFDSPSSPTITALFELPGLQNSDINVSVGRDGRLTVTGERRPPPLFDEVDQTGNRTRYPVSEIKFGKFERTVDITPGIEVCLLSFTLTPPSRFGWLPRRSTCSVRCTAWLPTSGSLYGPCMSRLSKSACACALWSSRFNDSS